MGSRKTDGSRITQARQSVVSLGSVINSSADRVTTETFVSNSGIGLASTLSAISGVQNVTTFNGWSNKISNGITGNDEITTQGTVFSVDVPNNPNPYTDTFGATFDDGLDIVRIALTGVQSLTGSLAQNKILWTQKIRDDLGISTVASTGTIRVCTFQASGVWGLDSTIRFSPVVAGYHSITVRQFDSNSILKWIVLDQDVSDNTNAVYLNPVGTFLVASGDYIEAWAGVANNGTSLDVGAVDTPFTHLTLTRQGT